MISFPKTDLLPGSVHVEFRTCGKRNCRCQSGTLHGPYYVRRWRENGRQRKAYVPAAEMPGALIATVMRRHLLPSSSSMARSIRP